jgi:hypothetical protein
MTDPGLSARIEQSHIPHKVWESHTPVIEAACQQHGIRPVDFDAWSVAEIYKQPDARTPPLRDVYAIAVLSGTALVAAREAGMFRKKLQFKSFEFTKMPGIRFWPEDNDTGNGWGSAELQGVASGGQPLMRLAWGWSHNNPHQQLAAALAERDRIMALLPN